MWKSPDNIYQLNWFWLEFSIDKHIVTPITMLSQWFNFKKEEKFDYILFHSDLKNWISPLSIDTCIYWLYPVRSRERKKNGIDWLVILVYSMKRVHPRLIWLPSWKACRRFLPSRHRHIRTDVSVYARHTFLTCCWYSKWIWTWRFRFITTDFIEC
jgi:hypothetical protein